MEQVIPSLALLLDPFRSGFRPEVFVNFRHVLVAWLLCPGHRTLTEVWQVGSWRAHRHYTALDHRVAAAPWHRDEIGALFWLLLLTPLVPGGIVRIVVDDTRCHKRGPRIARGGIFLDPVLSSKTRPGFRSGLNYVVLGWVVRRPLRPDRSHDLPVLWRVFRNKGIAGHRKNTELAHELAGLVAGLPPARAVGLLWYTRHGTPHAASRRERP